MCLTEIRGMRSLNWSSEYDMRSKDVEEKLVHIEVNELLKDRYGQRRLEVGPHLLSNGSFFINRYQRGEDHLLQFSRNVLERFSMITPLESDRRSLIFCLYRDYFTMSISKNLSRTPQTLFVLT